MSKKFIQPNINSIIISGRLTKDPSVRYGNTGTACAQVRIANNRAIKDNNDEWKQEVSFFNVVIWGKAAEKFGEIAHKGDSVIAEGWLKQREWEDNDGNRRNTVEIVARKIHDIERFDASGEVPKEKDVQENQSDVTKDDSIPF